jgi:hypothetical protein
MWRTLAACRIDIRVDVPFRRARKNVDTNVDAARCKRAPLSFPTTENCEADASFAGWLPSSRSMAYRPDLR